MRKTEKIKKEDSLVEGCTNIKVDIIPKNEFLDGCIIKTGYKSTIAFYTRLIEDDLRGEYQYNGVESDGRYVFEILREVPFVPIALEGISRREIEEIYKSVKKSPIYNENIIIVR